MSGLDFVLVSIFLAFFTAYFVCLCHDDEHKIVIRRPLTFHTQDEQSFIHLSAFANEFYWDHANWVTVALHSLFHTLWIIIIFIFCRLCLSGLCGVVSLVSIFFDKTIQCLSAFIIKVPKLLRNMPQSDKECVFVRSNYWWWKNCHSYTMQ